MTTNMGKVNGKSFCAVFMYNSLLVSKYEFLDP